MPQNEHVCATKNTSLMRKHTPCSTTNIRMNEQNKKVSMQIMYKLIFMSSKFSDNGVNDTMSMC